MIIALAETDLLIVKDFKPVRIVYEKSLDNLNKYYFTKLPKFDE